MTHRHVEARTIAERDNNDFPTEFEVRSGFRRDPDPFTGHAHPRTALYAVLVIAGLILFAVSILTWAHPHMVVPQ